MRRVFVTAPPLLSVPVAVYSPQMTTFIRQSQTPQHAGNPGVHFIPSVVFHSAFPPSLLSPLSSVLFFSAEELGEFLIVNIPPGRSVARCAVRGELQRGVDRLVRLGHACVDTEWKCVSRCFTAARTLCVQKKRKSAEETLDPSGDCKPAR